MSPQDATHQWKPPTPRPSARGIPKYRCSSTHPQPKATSRLHHPAQQKPRSGPTCTPIPAPRCCKKWLPHPKPAKPLREGLGLHLPPSPLTSAWPPTPPRKAHPSSVVLPGLPHHHPRRCRGPSKTGKRDGGGHQGLKEGCLRDAPRPGMGQGPGGGAGGPPPGPCPIPAPTEMPSETAPSPPQGLSRYLSGGSAGLPAAARRHYHLRRGGRFRWRRRWRRRGRRTSVGTPHPLTARPGATRRCCLVPPASHGERGPPPAAARTTANMAARPVRPLPGGKEGGGKGPAR